MSEISGRCRGVAQSAPRRAACQTPGARRRDAAFAERGARRQSAHSAGRARADGRQLLLAVPRRVRRAAADARPDRARLAGGVAGRRAKESAARVPTLDAWRADGRRRVEYSDPARRRGGHARRGAGAGGRVSPTVIVSAMAAAITTARWRACRRVRSRLPWVTNSRSSRRSTRSPSISGSTSSLPRQAFSDNPELLFRRECASGASPRLIALKISAIRHAPKASGSTAISAATTM